MSLIANGNTAIANITKNYTERLFATITCCVQTFPHKTGRLFI